MWGCRVPSAHPLGELLDEAGPLEQLGYERVHLCVLRILTTSRLRRFPPGRTWCLEPGECLTAPIHGVGLFVHLVEGVAAMRSAILDNLVIDHRGRVDVTLTDDPRLE